MFVGIDYSMTCPAICVFGKTISFWYAHDAKDYETLQLRHVNVIAGSVTQRAAHLATQALAFLRPLNPVRVAIEDYAYTASGRVFHIGENTGILKFFLESRQIPYILVPPTVVKKFATGKGNADKRKMTAAFLDAYPPAHQWIHHFFRRSTADSDVAKSPLADLADAYWIARYNAAQLA